MTDMTDKVRYQLDVTPDIFTFGWYNSLTYYMYHASPYLHKVTHNGYSYTFKYEDVAVGEWRDVLIREHINTETLEVEVIEWAFIIPVEWQEWEPKTSKMTVEKFVSEFESFVNTFGPIKIGDQNE